MSSAPGEVRVSVIVPTFNEARATLEASLGSLSAQTFTDFEVLVADESADPALAQACQALCARDGRFRYLRPPTRLGLAGSLNFALAQARGDLIARFDGDDLCAPTRLAAQVAFLDAHPEVGVVGSAMRIIDDQGAVRGLRAYPQAHDEIARRMQMTNAMAHPTVMIRADILRALGAYDPAFKAAEDLDLWLRLLNRGVRFANLAEPLISYRQTSSHRGPVNWSENLRARMKNLSARLLPWRLAGLAVVALWSVTPAALRRTLYDRAMLRQG